MRTEDGINIGIVSAKLLTVIMLPSTNSRMGKSNQCSHYPVFILVKYFLLLCIDYVNDNSVLMELSMNQLIVLLSYCWRMLSVQTEF